MPPDDSSLSDAGDSILVFCNFPNAEVARQIARVVVEKELAACVNILAPAESIYRWEGKIETEPEVPALIKSTLEAFGDLEAEIRALHPYDTPEVIALPIIAGSNAYLDWVQQSVRSRERSEG